MFSCGIPSGSNISYSTCLLSCTAQVNNLPFMRIKLSHRQMPVWSKVLWRLVFCFYCCTGIRTNFMLWGFNHLYCNVHPLVRPTFMKQILYLHIIQALKTIILHIFKMKEKIKYLFSNGKYRWHSCNVINKYFMNWIIISLNFIFRETEGCKNLKTEGLHHKRKINV